MDKEIVGYTQSRISEGTKITYAEFEVPQYVSMPEKPKAKNPMRVKINLSVDVEDAQIMERMAATSEDSTGYPCQVTDVIRMMIKVFIQEEQRKGTLMNWRLTVEK